MYGIFNSNSTETVTHSIRISIRMAMINNTLGLLALDIMMANKIECEVKRGGRRVATERKSNTTHYLRSHRVRVSMRTHRISLSPLV